MAKPKLNKSNGTATLIAVVPGPGTLTLTGKGIVKAMATSHGVGTVKLTVKAAKKLERALKKIGKAKVTADVTYTPTGGDANSKSTRVTLRLKRS